jgi:hypothetical protein
LIQSAYNSANWNGNGLTSTQANSGTYAVGHAEASATFTSVPATFSGQSVDNTSVLVKFTYYGDATMEGFVDINDSARVGANFNQSGKLWQDGDFNYDGTVNIGDYGLMATNWQLSPTLRPGDLPPLAYLYMSTLEYPLMYWTVRMDNALWLRLGFDAFEAMNLGPIPPMPPGMNARGIPEPAAGAGIAVAVSLAIIRRRRA